MSWLCKIRHKWEYSTEKVNIGKKGSNVHITLNVRMCKRCYKKQRQELVGELWFDAPLSKEEIREIKLNQLL
jgi:hypothetical protein